ncbi:hypothetical protein ACFSKI_04630 [Pseudogracilibacillus auburnensis]|uniref:Uncharacterized protein n=1 Tax=Pseudogracilibacillus auburnensis TaxID=1494959 RepID=A0A2V3W1T3_9BACI|nr:hypothetical protein [Pseudogracilibacillus auburnensis]MBO1002405.1 hypothetical protein [Pseudogracilibacillus auburnensis]PXW86205.1 hypothetical protein DFR56_10818 [Pseudogracilibacillus auburnensis]
MKRYLTTLFVGLSIISVFVGFQFDVRWNGIVSWGLACIFLVFAAYFTKYISNDSKERDDPQNII